MAAVGLAAGCAHAISPTRSDLERLRTSPDIPVVYRPSTSPWVDCSGDIAASTWSRGGGPSSIVWDQYQNQRTASLRRAPPIDPARATGDRFLALLRAAPSPLPFRESAPPAESTDSGALAKRFGPAPVLVFETTRWVLAGCWHTYQPWFNVRATLLDGSGKVVWRDTCRGLYPPDSSGEASPTELEANGGALYARAIEERAGRCAEELFANFERELPASR